MRKSRTARTPQSTVTAAKAATSTTQLNPPSIPRSVLRLGPAARLRGRRGEAAGQQERYVIVGRVAHVPGYRVAEAFDHGTRVGPAA